jgi:8-oxo-dGTP pyrophosphatase MutT (NUDIX family)
VTPPVLARRFDARFFLADARALAPGEPRPSAELDEVRWLSFAEARAVELPSVTRFILREVELALEAPRPPVFLRVLHGRRRADPIPDLPTAAD